MSVKVFDIWEVQDLLKVVLNVGGSGIGGNVCMQQIVLCLFGDLFKVIDDFDIMFDEVWVGVNYLNKFGQDGEVVLFVVGFGFEKYFDIWMDVEDEVIGFDGGMLCMIEGLLYVVGVLVCDSVVKIDFDVDDGVGLFVIYGMVIGFDGKLIVGVVVECWYVNLKGFYLYFDLIGKQSDFNLCGVVKMGVDGKYEFCILMLVGYGCLLQGVMQ